MDGIDLTHLRELIGQGVFYRGIPCCIIEILEDGPTVVLEGSRPARQPDQYGDPHREVPETYTIPVRHASGEFNPEFLQMRLRGETC